MIGDDQLGAVDEFGRVRGFPHRDAFAPPVADVGPEPDQEDVTAHLDPEAGPERGDQIEADPAELEF
jgi:hypothetical protein